MPKKYMVIDHNSVLCLKHFAPADVVVFSKSGGESNNGTKNAMKSGLPLVKEGAIPLHFSNEVEEKINDLKVGW